MKRTIAIMSAIALVAAACGGGDSSSGCAGVVDEGVDLLQQTIDELAGLSLSDLENDPFEDPELENKFNELEQRSNDEGCTDEELSELFAEGFDRLEASEDNPAGTFLVGILQQAADEGGFEFSN